MCVRCVFGVRRCVRYMRQVRFNGAALAAGAADEWSDGLGDGRAAARAYDRAAALLFPPFSSSAFSSSADALAVGFEALSADVGLPRVRGTGPPHWLVVAALLYRWALPLPPLPPPR